MKSFLRKIVLYGILINSYNYSSAMQSLDRYDTSIEDNKRNDVVIKSSEQISWNVQVGKYDRTAYFIDDFYTENDVVIRNGHIIAKYDRNSDCYKIGNINCYPCGNNTKYKLTIKDNNKLYFLDNMKQTEEQIMDNFPTQLNINNFSVIYNNEKIFINLDANNTKYNLEYNDKENPGTWQISEIGKSVFAKYNNGWILTDSQEELSSSNFNNEEDNINKYVTNNFGIYLCNQILAKYNKNDNKWYKTNDSGDITTEEFYTAILIINDGCKIKFTNDNNKFYFNITKLGKLINNGKITIGNNCELIAPEHNIQYFPNNFAIDNTNGTLAFKDNGSMNNASPSFDKYSIVKGGNIKIDKLIDWTNISAKHINESIENNGKNIKSVFYNATIHLFPKKLNNINDIIEFFSNNENFYNNKTLLFPNMKFLPDIKENNTVIESRHSEIIIPNLITVIKDINKYNTNKNVIVSGFSGINNIIKLFYKDDDINDEFKENPPLSIKAPNDITTLSDFLNNSVKYNKNYKLDLLSFYNENEEKIIDYSKLNDHGIDYLNNIQFVANNNIERNKLNLLLLPQYLDFNGMKLVDNTLNINEVYAKWRGVITIPNTIARVILRGNKKSGKKYSYIIKAHDYMAIQTTGNIDLIFDNSGTLHLYDLSNDNSNNSFSISQYKPSHKSSSLNLKVLKSGYRVSKLNVDESVQLEKMNQDSLMLSTKSYHMLYKLLYDCMKGGNINTVLFNKSLFFSELNNINNYLIEIEDSDSTTEYANYFKAMNDDGEIPENTTGIKTYEEVASIQDNLIKINNFKVKILEKYVTLLNIAKSKINNEDNQNKFNTDHIIHIINEDNGILTIAKKNQIKMLQNKLINSNDEDKKILESLIESYK